MEFEVVSREVLRHNRLNAVTASVERVRGPGGGTAIRKVLRAPSPDRVSDGDGWAASDDPRHWNFWRREADAYRDPGLRGSLRSAGLDLPAAEVVEQDGSVVLWMEDVQGTAGPGFTLDDHRAVAAGVGRWQAQGPMTTSWTSRRFLREYSGSRPAPVHLLDDDSAWAQPLVRDTWPAGLRQGWQRLTAHREELLATMEHLPRTRSHLDLWVANEIRRPGGEVVLIDWAFAGDGTFGEDLGNHVPDAAFDLFWPAERIAELEATCFEAYVAGLRESGWRGDVGQVRLGMVSSCVKYAWLLPRMLAAAGRARHQAYQQDADPEQLYCQRGLVLALLVSWCDEALRLQRR